MSIDVERDITRHLGESYLGIDEAMPVLLEALLDSGIVPDLFVEAPVARHRADVVRKAMKSGCFIGCHGEHLDPILATELKDRELLDRFDKGSRALEAVTGKVPLAFREANFAVDSRTLGALSQTGFLADSSVLPSRLVRKHGVQLLVDHRGAPDMPYRPGFEDHVAPGVGPLLEIPVTENPLNHGAPIGTGFLNWKGPEWTLKALQQASGDPITFLIHPWECVDLSRVSADLPQWVLEICKENSKAVATLLEVGSTRFEPATLPAIAAEFGVDLV